MSWKYPAYHDELVRLQELGVYPGCPVKVRIGSYGTVPWTVEGFYSLSKSRPQTLFVCLKAPSGQRRTVFSWEIREIV